MIGYIDSFTRGFDDNMNSLLAISPSWLNNIKQQSRENYIKLGMPTTRLEQWKYTSLKQLQKYGFCDANDINDNDLNSFVMPLSDMDAYRFVFINGKFNAVLSDMAGLGNDMEISSLAVAIKKDPDRFKDIFAGLENKDIGAMAALNNACFKDGLFMSIKPNISLQKPIYIISYGMNNNDQDAVAFHPRNYIHMGENSTATLLESHVGSSGVTLSNSQSHIKLENNAKLQHYKNQNEAINSYHLAVTDVILADNAIYNNFTLQIGGAIARNEVNCKIIGQNAEAHINGASFANNIQHIDNTSLIEHIASNSKSFEAFKIVVDDNARGVFQGKIKVHKAAQKTDGKQMSRALLLSKRAEVNAKPELEIYADDVKCSHGSTVGQLDEMQLFYLISRGIDEKTARNLLIQAFLYEIFDKIQAGDIKQAFISLMAIKLTDLTSNDLNLSEVK